MTWTKRALFLVECLDLCAASGVDDAEWEQFQIAHLCDETTMRLETKARQIAWSFTVAAEGVANAILDGLGTIYVSINQEEAREKIRYARTVYQNLSISGLPGIVRDNELGLEFANGARLISHPATPPRGKARMNVVLDELAHIQHDRQIYTAALPVLTRGGKLRVGSSPLGAGGLFWELSEQRLRQYPGFVRVQTPWWKVGALLSSEPGPSVELLPTPERVERYGNGRIKLLFENMLLEDFQQEFECAFSDETTAWIPWEKIIACQDATLRYWKATSLDQAHAMIDQMASMLPRLERVMVGGVDIGRKHNLTEITLLGIGPPNRARLTISLFNTGFVEQEQVMLRLLDVLPVQALLIDETGIGNELAERVGTGTVAQGVTFTNKSKTMWAVETRIAIEGKGVVLPVDRDLAYQVHSVKRKVTAARNIIFDTERNEAHHADKFWSLALALWAAKEYNERPQWGAGPEWER